MAAFVALASYQSDAGVPAQAELGWPEGSQISAPTQPTLLLFLHPECGCSRATVAELGRLRARVSRPHRLFIVWSAPGESLRRLAGLQQGAAFLEDPDAVEARRFGATTSGHLFLYGANGRLRFHGGITAARAHEGDNLGAQTVVRLLEAPAEEAEVATTPVFGCPLYADHENA